MRRPHVLPLILALCLVVLTGCSALTGPATDTVPTDTPTTPGDGTATDTGSVSAKTDRPSTATPARLELPSGVDESAVLRYSSLSTSERATFRAARNASGYVELESDSALETFSNHGYVFDDGRLWQVEAGYGRVAYYASTTALSENETAVAFGDLTAERQRRFRRVVNRSGSYALGPDERAIGFPDPVRYDGQTYVVERGTASSAYGVLHVSPYDTGTDTPA